MGASEKFSELDPWRKHEEPRIAHWRQAKGDRKESLPGERMR
jgi:hypothetical protein